MARSLLAALRPDHAYHATADGDGVHEHAPRWPGEPGVSRFAERHAYGWDGTFFVGPLSPSMPLVR